MADSTHNQDRVAAALEALASRLGAIEELTKDIPALSSAVLNVKDDVAAGIQSAIQDVLPTLLAATGAQASRGAHAHDADTDVNAQSAAVPRRLSHEDITLMEKIAQPDQATDHILRWLQYMAALSLASHSPQLKTWRGGDNAVLLQSLSPVLSGVSGLALALFSVPNGDSKAMYAKTDGTVWTFVMRWVMAEMIQEGRRKHFSASPLLQPQWLRDFGDKRRTVEIVNHCLSSFLDYRPFRGDPLDETRPPSKLRRVGSKTKKDRRSSDADPDQALLTRIRSRLLNNLSGTRRKVKLFLFRHLLFLFEKIRCFPSPEAARSAGFFVNYGAPDLDIELSQDSSGRGIWDIPLALTFASGEELSNVDQRNHDSLEKVIQDFPSLTVTLFWRQTVLFSSGDTDKEHPDYNDHGLYWEAQSTVHLHRCVVHMLGELTRTEDNRRVLRASPSSIRGVHAMAIGLRAVMRDSHCLTLSSTEVACRGNVRMRMRDTNEEVVSILFPTLRTTHLASSSATLPGQPLSPSATTPSLPAVSSQTDAVTENSTLSTPRKRSQRPSRSPARNDDVTEIMKSKFEISWAEYLGNLRNMEIAQGSDRHGNVSSTAGIHNISQLPSSTGEDIEQAVTLTRDITDQLVDIVNNGAFY